jgi:hypothetical protein
MKDEPSELPKAPAAPPPEYAGQWVAWDSREHTQIIAHGRELKAVIRAAKELGYSDPVFQKAYDPRRARI